jgi:hypothetical protein
MRVVTIVAASLAALSLVGPAQAQATRLTWKIWAVSPEGVSAVAEIAPAGTQPMVLFFLERYATTRTTPTSGKVYQSAVSAYEVDCAGRKVRNMAFAYYGVDDVAVAASTTPGAWAAPSGPVITAVVGKRCDGTALPGPEHMATAAEARVWLKTQIR